MHIYTAYACARAQMDIPVAAVLLVPRETLSAPCSTPLVRDGESGSIAAAVVVVVVV